MTSGGEQLKTPCLKVIVMRPWQMTLQLSSWIKFEKSMMHYNNMTNTHQLETPMSTYYQALEKWWDEVIKMIGEMSPKSCELDAIPSSLLKWLVTDLAPGLTKLVNTSLTLGGVCNRLEDVNHHAIIKETRGWIITGKLQASKYLSFISKLVEKCALKQFIQHCNDQGILYQTTKVHTEVDTVQKQHWSRSEIISCNPLKINMHQPL